MKSVDIEVVVNDFEVIVLTAPWVYGTTKYLEILQKKLNLVCIEVNIDTDPILADKYDVVVLPTIVILKKGEEFSRFNGFVPFDLVSRSLNLAKGC